MVNTQPRNKDAHPGMPDLPNPQKTKDKEMTLQNQQQLAIQRVAAVEHELMENQQHANNNACQPPGPSRSGKQRAPQAHTYIKVVEAVGLSAQPKQLAARNIAADSAGQTAEAVRTSTQFKQLAMRNLTADSAGQTAEAIRKSNQLKQLAMRNLTADSARPAIGSRDGALSTDESEYERPPNRGGKGRVESSVRAAILQEKEVLKKNNQHTSQQGTSAKPSSNSRPARHKINKCEDKDMQVDDEGMGDDEEREATEGTEMNERCNEASKAVESSTKRKTHERGNNPSPASGKCGQKDNPL
ncbi:hypothetical protein SCLCIDRAFT_28091 [Scleroderma citrinum Foug A]|uniref:Uncharacterized protein n=1 Tax=Scleroderma citrinum Foug A TaxID=1036808 RepID=A0A0C2Z931_9AGAM|nr:hypothetical protein SCLCIDRAFT_28091 [Scleroderma citrinum Foug A]